MSKKILVEGFVELDDSKLFAPLHLAIAYLQEQSRAISLQHGSTIVPNEPYLETNWLGHEQVEFRLTFTRYETDAELQRREFLERQAEEKRERDRSRKAAELEVARLEKELANAKKRVMGC